MTVKIEEVSNIDMPLMIRGIADKIPLKELIDLSKKVEKMGYGEAFFSLKNGELITDNGIFALFVNNY